MKTIRHLLAAFTVLLIALLPLPSFADSKFKASPTPTISGRVVPGETLSVNLGTWNPAPTSFTYTWKRDSIAVSSAETYQPTADDLGHRISVTVVGSLSGYLATTRTSSSTTVSLAFTAIAPVVPLAIFAGDSVSPICTEQCFLYPDSWTPTPTRITYQWLRNGVAIKNATSYIYTATEADAGKTLQLKATGTRSGYETRVLFSNISDPVMLYTFNASEAPAIDDTTPKFNQELNASTGSLYPEPSKVSYQWLRNGVAIAKARDTVYTTVAADVGQKISFRVTSYLTNYETLVADSPETEVVEPELMTVPTRASVIGIFAVGKTLTASPGAWQPSGVKMSYQWYRNGDPIAGATKITYKLQAIDEDAQLEVYVTGTKPGYATTTISSEPSDPVQATTFSRVGKLTVGGTLSIAGTLIANEGQWLGDPLFEYQWFKDGVAIEGETQRELALDSGDGGHAFSYSLRATADGLGTVQLMSPVSSKWKIGTATLVMTGEEVVDLCDDPDGTWCYYDDGYPEWAYIDSDDASETFDLTLEFDLDYEPIKWRTLFTSTLRSKVAFINDGTFSYFANNPLDPDNDYDAETTITSGMKKVSSKWSSKHDGSTVSWSLQSDDSYATINFNRMIIEYTYYK